MEKRKHNTRVVGSFVKKVERIGKIGLWKSTPIITVEIKIEEIITTKNIGIRKINKNSRNQSSRDHLIWLKTNEI